MKEAGDCLGTRVMRYPLTYVGGCGDYHNLNNELWSLQKKTRELANRTIQMMYSWDQESYAHFLDTGAYLDIKAVHGCPIDTYIYRELKDRYAEFATGNYSATIRRTKQKYNNLKSQIQKGQISLPSYKSNQPVILRADNCKILEKEGDIFFNCSFFSDAYRKENGYDRVTFKIGIKDNTQKAIISRVVDKTYKLGDCQLVYGKGWTLFLAYTFDDNTNPMLDPEKILGVDLGVTNALYAGSNGFYERLPIPGTEAIVKANQIEARTHAMQKQARHCGEGRIGHGTRTRVAPIYNAQDQLARYRDTINHRYSRRLIDFAVQYGYGTIQMEDLSGIKDSSRGKQEDDYIHNRLLRHWTYYDLQQKIKYKAEEAGIKVVYVNPHYTSQRCSRCGCISRENRPNQATFKCKECGFETNADYNAALNLSIPKIEKVIEKWQKEHGANHEDTSDIQ